MDYIKIGIMDSGQGVEIYKYNEELDYPYYGVAEMDDDLIPMRWDKNGLSEHNTKCNFDPSSLISVGDIVVGRECGGRIDIIGELVDEEEDGFIILDHNNEECIVRMIAKYVEPGFGIQQDEAEEDTKDNREGSIADYLEVVNSVIEAMENNSRGKSK